jgi:hypothetical protein
LGGLLVEEGLLESAQGRSDGEAFNSRDRTVPDILHRNIA